MSRTSVVAKARSPFWVNGFPQPAIQIVGNPCSVAITSSEPPMVHEGAVFSRQSRTFAVVPPGHIQTIHQADNESPRPSHGSAVAFRQSLLNLGDQTWAPATYATVERIFPHEGLASYIQNLPLNPSDIPNPPPTITYATILPCEPPRPEDGRYVWCTKQILNPTRISNVTPTCIAQAESPKPEHGTTISFVRRILVLSQLPAGPPDYVSQEPPRPYEGAANIFASRPLIVTQVYGVPPRIAQVELPRPEPGSLVAYVHASLETRQFAPVPSRLIRSEPPRPESGSYYVWTRRELVTSQIQPPPAWARQRVDSEPQPAYAGSVFMHANTVLSLQDLSARSPLLASAEPPLPSPGSAVTYSSNVFTPPQYATSFSAYAEPPRPEPGASVAFANRPFIPSQLRPWPARITPFEPPRPERGFNVFLTNRPLVASQLHVNPVIIVSAEPPRPEGGRWYCYSNTTLSVQTYPNPWISPSKLKK